MQSDQLSSAHHITSNIYIEAPRKLKFEETPTHYIFEENKLASLGYASPKLCPLN